jgi:hypothetical protein
MMTQTSYLGSPQTGHRPLPPVGVARYRHISFLNVKTDVGLPPATRKIAAARLCKICEKLCKAAVASYWWLWLLARLPRVW